MKLSPEQKEQRRIARREAARRRIEAASIRHLTDHMISLLPVKPKQIVKIGKPDGTKPEAWKFKVTLKRRSK